MWTWEVRPTCPFIQRPLWCSATAVALWMGFLYHPEAPEASSGCGGRRLKKKEKKKGGEIPIRMRASPLSLMRCDLRGGWNKGNNRSRRAGLSLIATDLAATGPAVNLQPGNLTHKSVTLRLLECFPRMCPLFLFIYPCI